MHDAVYPWFPPPNGNSIPRGSCCNLAKCQVLSLISRLSRPCRYILVLYLAVSFFFTAVGRRPWGRRELEKAFEGFPAPTTTEIYNTVRNINSPVTYHKL